MNRFIFALVAALSLIVCDTVHGQGRSGCREFGRRQTIRPGNYRAQYPRSTASLGFGVGIGSYPGYGYGFGGPSYFDAYRFYGVDPWRTGRFRAPDLLDDPYFRAQNKFNSRFPGRYKYISPAPLELRPTPVPARRAYGAIESPPIDVVPSAPRNSTELSVALRASARQLMRTLAARDNGAAWMAYLEPHRIGQWITDGNSAALDDLLKRFDSVAGNPNRTVIASADGFASTRKLLAQYVTQPSQLNGPLVERPAAEQLPLPEAKSDAEPLPLSDDFAPRNES